METIDKALQKIEASKQAIAEAEQLLASILQSGEVPTVKEPEPAQEPIDVQINNMGVVEVEDKTPPRTDLVCPCDLNCKVYDNRPNKKSGQYKATAPDFTCSNNTDCPNQKQGHSRMLRKSWWLDSNDLPQDWINTKVPHDPSKDYVDTTKKNEEGGSYSPFS